MEFENRLKGIKLIVFDLDGTLLNDDGMIGIRSKQLIKQLEERDVHFSFATGRLHSAITAFAEELQLKSPLISLDGCLIKSFPDNNLLFESNVKRKHVLKAISFAENFLINIALCHGDAIYYTEYNSIIPRITDKFGARYEEVHSYDECMDNTLEILLAGENYDLIKFVQSRMDFPYMFGLTSASFKSQRHKDIYYLEIRRKGSSKRTGVFRLLKYFRLNIKEAAVCGDWYNDLSLFQTRALKVAVANAVSEIKGCSDIILEKSNNEDGTADFLEMVLKAKKRK
ncbi:MAG: HAD family hydrolase [Ignavibacteriaceae bacterium]|nr:HAD family hydrolase [Ignavibacteriaceae bacterium]